jgi:hypothetical protein
MLTDLSFISIATTILGLVFGGFAVANFVGPQWMRDGYARWGYPVWWRFVTGTLDFAAALLLLTPGFAIYGIAIAAFVCFSAFTTLIWHREFSHVPPSATLFVILTSLAIAG